MSLRSILLPLPVSITSCGSEALVLQAILALMSDAAPDSPLNCDAGNLLRAGDIRGYNAMARMYAIEYASVRA